MRTMNYYEGRNLCPWETAPLLVIAPRADIRPASYVDLAIGCQGTAGGIVVVDYASRRAWRFVNAEELLEWANSHGMVTIRLEAPPPED